LRGVFFLFIASVLGVAPAQAFDTGVPIKLVITPSTVKEADATRATVKVLVVLRSPAPCYFICELRSSDRRQLSLTDIIFRKGDTEGFGAGTVDWSEVPADGSIQVLAFSTDAPDQTVSASVLLQRKQEESP
jgi:hypothetical protein